MTPAAQLDVPGALALWAMSDGVATLAAHRENTVWRVDHCGRAYALRFHRPGYRTAAQLESELCWMQALAAGGLSVPRPVARPDGGLTGQVGKHHVSLLDWMPGRPVGAVGGFIDIDDIAGLCRNLGRQIARLHDLSDAWTPPPGFTRPDWRRAGLLGDDPLWGRFWAHPHLSDAERDLIITARQATNVALAEIEQTADQGLIHADLLAENVMIHDGALTFIDFDDCAFGFRDFELATVLVKFLHQPYLAQMRTALIDGYGARRAVDPATLDLFLLVRALTYPGWSMARIDEPGGADRSRRAITTALDLARQFLAT